MKLRIGLALLLSLGGLPHAVSAEWSEAAESRAIPVVGIAAPVAHEPGQGYMFLRVHGDSMVVRLELLAGHLDEALQLGWGAETPTIEQVEAVLPRLREYAEANMAIALEGQDLPLRFNSVSNRFVDFGEFVILEYALDLSPTPDELEFTFTPFFELYSQHRNIQVVEYNWMTGTYNEETNITLIFSPSSTTQTLDLTDSSIWRGFMAMVWQGVWHIWIGTDHILFLVALVLPSVMTLKNGRWEPAESFKAALIKIVTIVTFFTLAHSVTLSLAALDLVSLPSTLVETIIALSIAAAALHNLMPKIRVKEAAIAFLFGLFHGFGFATVLGDIGLGRDFLVLSLLGFNVGVELGQVAIIAGLFCVLFMVRKTTLYRWMFNIVSVGLIGIALLWAAERTFGFNVGIVPGIVRFFRWIFG